MSNPATRIKRARKPRSSPESEPAAVASPLSGMAAVTSPSIVDLVHLITQFNAVWKQAREAWGDTSPFTTILRERKTQLQLRLLRTHPEAVRLVVDRDGEYEEPLYSVRLQRPVTLSDGQVRRDADHIPVRLVECFMTPDEIEQLTGVNDD